MSLLNQVLRDLDSREGGVETLELKLAPEVQGQPEEAPVDNPGRDWPRLVAWTLVAGAVSVWIGSWYFQPDLPSAEGPIQVKTPLPVNQETLPTVAPQVQQSSSPIDKVAEPGIAEEIPKRTMFEKPAESQPVLAAADKKGIAATYVPLKITEDPQLAESSRKPAKRKSPAVPLPADNPSVRKSASVAKVRSKMIKAQKTEPLTARAKRLIDQGELSQAEQLLRKSLAASPRERVAHELLVGLLVRGGRAEEALKQIDVAHRQSGYNGTLDLIAARLLMQKGEKQKAVLRLQAILQDQPASTDALRLLAASHFADGRR